MTESIVICALSGEPLTGSADPLLRTFGRNANVLAAEVEGEWSLIDLNPLMYAAHAREWPNARPVRCVPASDVEVVL